MNCSKYKIMNMNLPVKSLLAILLLATTNACSTQSRYVSQKKETNEPQPRRLEAPFNQYRETYRDNDTQSTTIPDLESKPPSIIEQNLLPAEKNVVLLGILIEGREGLILSPYAPDEGLIDVRGFPVGSLVKDPYTGKAIRIPQPLTPKRNPEQTLSSPKFEQPEINLPGKKTKEPTQVPTLE